jgi:hypothetical protein
VGRVLPSFGFVPYSQRTHEANVDGMAAKNKKGKQKQQDEQPVDNPLSGIGSTPVQHVFFGAYTPYFLLSGL